MYSVVLMMALTSGGDAPALGHGCNGCYGGGMGCYGGCHGGHRMHGCHGGHRMHGCHGGCMGCYGGGMSCYGGGHGCRGGHHRRHGCCGCNGGGYGHGCMGCYGGGMGCYGGGMGGYGFGAGMGGVGGAIVPGTAIPSLAPTTTPAPAKNKTSLDNAAPATLIVTVPAEAQLSIDGEATTSTATQRVFVSPALNFGREYHYTLKAEFNKDGKKVTLNKEVAVKAGEETRVRFDADNSAEVASR